MKPFFNIAALCALVAVSGSAFAQGNMTNTQGTANMQGNMNPANPQGTMDMKMSAGDAMKAKWAFYNADRRELNRFKAKGFSDLEFRGIANIAYEAGLSTDYVARQVKEIGRPFNFVATMFGVPTTNIFREIPGFGAASSSELMGMMGGGTMGGKKTDGGMGNGAMATGTVVDVAMSDPQFSTLVAAIKAAGLVDTLKGSGPFTVLAPTNAAFDKLPAGALEDLLKPENKEKLVSILTYHVVPGKLRAADVMGMSNPSMPTTVNGKQLTVKTTAPVTVNGANVIKTDIEASNGVIHVIDTVLMPE